jgi:hypothetical protein
MRGLTKLNSHERSSAGTNYQGISLETRTGGAGKNSGVSCDGTLGSPLRSRDLSLSYLVTALVANRYNSSLASLSGPDSVAVRVIIPTESARP